jgi:catechol 2,3-dioxygenase-like lactoylglutathione lyase family enzyme
LVGEEVEGDVMVTFWGKAVTVGCTDLERSVRFYEGTLGAKRLLGDGYGCPWFQLGSLTITLLPNAAEPSPASFPEHPMLFLWLEVDDLAAAYKRFKAAEVEVLRPPDGQFMLVADPDGLLIEIWSQQASAAAGGR